MNSDVIPEVGGFLIIRIDSMGYMRNAANQTVVHRETRDLHKTEFCITDFVKAKQCLSDEGDSEHAILELTRDGGGAFVWMTAAQKETLEGRLARFRGCYGGWPTRTLGSS